MYSLLGQVLKRSRWLDVPLRASCGSSQYLNVFKIGGGTHVIFKFLGAEQAILERVRSYSRRDIRGIIHKSAPPLSSYQKFHQVLQAKHNLEIIVDALNACVIVTIIPI